MSQANENSSTDAASGQPEAAQRSNLFDHPIGFWFFFWGEFAERSCYYGMRAILLLYMIQILGFEDGNASKVIAYFIAGCYLLPLIGGYVADNFIGKYRTIVYFSVPYIFGQAILAVAALHNETCLFLSLGLLAMGSGVIKPNISTLMGQTYDQRRPGLTKLRSDAFAMFYGAINIGAAISSFGVPAIRNYFGGDSRAYAIAFLLPTALMIMAFIVFAAGKPFYAVEKISRVHPTPDQRRERLAVLSRLFGLFLVVAVFWSIFDQSVSTWTLFARDHLHLELFGLPLSPDQLQTVNPILIVLLLPPITMLWHFLARIGLDLKPTSKMLVGFVLTAITMAIVAWAGYRGAEVAVAGAPDVRIAARQATELAAEMVGRDKPAVEAAARIIAAVVADRDTPGQETAPKVAEEVMAAADPGAVAVATASAAATAVGRSADAVARALGDPTWVAAALDAAEAAAAAADATTKAVKAATAAIRERGHATTLDMALVSAAANRAANSAASATKAAEALQGNHDALAQTNAAVATLAAADAAALTVQAVGQARGSAVPAAVAAVKNAAAKGRISLLWQVIPYLLITVAEICISVVGLELAFAAAPATMKSFVTACWLLCVFFGNILNAQITPLYNNTFLGLELTPGRYFLGFAVVMVPVTLAFLVMARRFNRPATDQP